MPPVPLVIPVLPVMSGMLESTLGSGMLVSKVGRIVASVVGTVVVRVGAVVLGVVFALSRLPQAARVAASPKVKKKIAIFFIMLSS